MKFYRLDTESKVKYLLRSASKPRVARRIASIIDNTELNEFATGNDIRAKARESLKYGMNLCVYPSRINDALDVIRGSNVRLYAVNDFPNGLSGGKEKGLGILECFKRGADGCDTVNNLGLLHDVFKAKHAAFLQEEVHSYNSETAEKRYLHDLEDLFRELRPFKDRSLRVILRTPYLENWEIEYATKSIAEIGRRSGMHTVIKEKTGKESDKFIKNNTDRFETIRGIRKVAGEYNPETNKIGVKPAGGISDAATVMRMLLAAECVDENGGLEDDLQERIAIGTSHGLKILKELE